MNIASPQSLRSFQQLREQLLARHGRPVSDQSMRYPHLYSTSTEPRHASLGPVGMDMGNKPTDAPFGADRPFRPSVRESPHSPLRQAVARPAEPTLPAEDHTRSPSRTMEASRSTVPLSHAVETDPHSARVDGAPEAESVEDEGYESEREQEGQSDGDEECENEGEVVELEEEQQEDGPAASVAATPAPAPRQPATSSASSAQATSAPPPSIPAPTRTPAPTPAPVASSPDRTRESQRREPARAAAAESTRTAPQPSVQPTPAVVVEGPEPNALSEQVLKLQAWERELQERERQLQAYKDSLSRPLGAHMPPRPAQSASAPLAPRHSEESRQYAASPFDSLRVSQESACSLQGHRLETSSYRPPDIHIHNHISPTAVTNHGPPVAPPAVPAASAAPDGQARFPYDRVVDYDSAEIPLAPEPLPSFPYEYSARSVQGDRARASASAPTRPTYTVDPAAQSRSSFPEPPRPSFTDRHELHGRLYDNYPAYREPPNPARSPLSVGRVAGAGSATVLPDEEVDLSGLSLAVSLPSRLLRIVSSLL